MLWLSPVSLSVLAELGEVIVISLPGRWLFYTLVSAMTPNVQDHTPGKDITIILENLEHCGGKPERADTEILVTDELMSDLTSSKQIL